MGFLTLGCALAMEEPLPRAGKGWPSMGDGFKATCAAGCWILATPFALAVIGVGLIFDGVMRVVIALSGQYYRVIGLFDASFGVVGALVAPRLARHLAETHAPFFGLFPGFF